jgi:amylosucrase/maltose alpha-D-glucosyltransferase/alpha-amylase
MDTQLISLASEAEISLARLLPRIETRFKDETDPAEWNGFIHRVKAEFPRLFTRLHALYGHRYDFFFHLESVMVAITQAWRERPGELRALDALRVADPHWYEGSRMVGAMCYVDLFSGDLKSLRDRVSYLSELGITCLHLMPLFAVPQGDDDGGYAVKDFRTVDPDLGTMDELRDLATALRHRGISLILDFVFNHTSDEHEWAMKAKAGERTYQEYYYMFPDRQLPDAYEASMPEVFTEDHPGAFTYESRLKQWVWTTFHTYQWDLNYRNPEVFTRMVEEMLFLANQGVEVLRLDAVAFLWKKMGTNCQNLPEVHAIIQAFNAAAAMAAPATVLLSEAIVHPDEVRKYIGTDECPLSYNSQLMALLWEALATREVKVLRRSLEKGLRLPSGCSWLNYLRCHDDIGWAFSDEEVIGAGFDPAKHRRFLTDFFTGEFPGSFARGEPFQEDPETGQARVSGTCASLAGLEKALEYGDAEGVELALGRILLLHGVLMTIGGIPLLYLGDEIGSLNDSSYGDHPSKVGDSRWLHRAPFDWDRAQERRDPDSVPGRIYHGLLRLVQVRTQTLAFHGTDTEITDTGNSHVFGFLRSHLDETAFVIANFSEREQSIEARRLRQMGMRKTMVDLFAGRTITAARELRLGPYQIMVLRKIQSS